MVVQCWPSAHLLLAAGLDAIHNKRVMASVRGNYGMHAKHILYILHVVHCIHLPTVLCGAIFTS
jgi:hypothetical protein